MMVGSYEAKKRSCGPVTEDAVDLERPRADSET